MRWALILTAILLSQACVNHVEIAKQSLESTVITYNKISYRELQTYPGEVVCGEYTTSRASRDDRYKPFIYRLGRSDTRPSKQDLAIFCSADPQQSFYAVYGIEVAEEEQLTLPSIQDDYRQLTNALEQYQLDNAGYPRSKQGLEALVRPSDIAPKPARFREGGYLDELPQDPWGTPYLYTGPTFAGSKGWYTLLTLGADGSEGGVGKNADVASYHIKYIDHIEKL